MLTCLVSRFTTIERKFIHADNITGWLVVLLGNRGLVGALKSILSEMVLVVLLGNRGL